MSFNKILIKNIVQDKIEEISLKTRRSAAAKRVAQVRDPKFKGEEVPIYKAGTKEQIGTRRKPGKGVLAKRIAKHYSKDKIGSAPLDIPSKKREDSSSQPVYDRMAELLIERSLVKDVYNAGRGLVGGLLGAKKDRREKSNVYKTSRFLGSAVGTPTRAIAKAGAKAGMAGINLVGSGIGKVGDLASGFKRKLKLKSALKQRQLRKQQAYDALPMMPGLVDKNANRIGKAERKPGQETEAQRKALKASARDVIAAKEKQAQVAAKKALASRKRKVKRRAQKAAQAEKSRKLVNYESTSYRDIMLQKIAEMRLIERLPEGENINEWVWMIPWAIRAGQLGLNAYRAYKGARAVGTAVRAGKSAYDLAKTAGTGRALAQGLSAGGKSLAKSAARAGGTYAATQALDKMTGASDMAKKYVAKKAIEDLSPDVANIASGVKKAYSGLSTASKASKLFGSNKKDKKEQDPSGEQQDRSYSAQRGYTPIEDEDDDQ